MCSTPVIFLPTSYYTIPNRVYGGGRRMGRYTCRPGNSIIPGSECISHCGVGGEGTTVVINDNMRDHDVWYQGDQLGGGRNGIWSGSTLEADNGGNIAWWDSADNPDYGGVDGRKVLLSYPNTHTVVRQKTTGYERVILLTTTKGVGMVSW